MIDYKLTIDATTALAMLAKLEDKAVYRTVAEAVADDVVLPALAQANYPAQSGKKMKFASDKARRYFFAALADGAIQVPYQRSGDTGSSYEKVDIPDGITVISAKASAAYTRGGGPDQAEYHRGNWKTHEELALSLEGPAADTATAALLEELEA